MKNDQKIKNRILAGLALAGLLFAVGCETTAGAGRDLEAAGDAIEDAAEDAQGY